MYEVLSQLLLDIYFNKDPCQDVGYSLYSSICI